MSMTERWSGTNIQHQFEDGSWVNFMRGTYDDRDIMSDCVRPQWNGSGEYLVELIPAGYHNNSDADFVATVNKEWANKIYYNLSHGIIKTMNDFKAALRNEGRKSGTYKKRYNIIKESVELGL